MQGIYRVQGAGSEYLESFVAAPGPAGWRYFGRVSSVESETELFTVDFVVDTDWGLVRYRERHADGREIMAAPDSSGVQVVKLLGDEERIFNVPDADVVWSSSPCSVLVAERRARASGRGWVVAARIDGEDSAGVTVSVRDSESVSGTLEVEVDGRTTQVVMTEEAPLSADGWFERIS